MGKYKKDEQAQAALRSLGSSPRPAERPPAVDGPRSETETELPPNKARVDALEKIAQLLAAKALEKRKDVADKPHLYTLIIGVFTAISGFMAMGALYFNIQNVDNSVKAMKIAQRAYLSGSLSACKHTYDAESGLHCLLTIKNVGNSPASAVSYAYFSTYSNPYAEPNPNYENGGFWTVQDVGPKTETVSEVFSTTSVQAKESKRDKLFMMSIRYTDVFSDRQEVKVCWIVTDDDQIEGCNIPSNLPPFATHI